jgi:hypothetical protein
VLEGRDDAHVDGRADDDATLIDGPERRLRGITRPLGIEMSREGLRAQIAGIRRA